MEYILIESPPYPFFVYAGDALFRPGDFHRQRSAMGYFDILFVESGCLYMEENGNKYEVRENDVLVLHPQHTHRSYKACEEETYFHWLHFLTTEHFWMANSFPKEWVSSRSHKKQKIQVELLIIPIYQTLNKEAALHIFNSLKNLESLAINRYFQSSMVSKTGTAISSKLRQQELFLNMLSNLTLNDHNSTGNRIAHMVMQFIQANYSKNITLKEMAEVANCHPTHVIRSFSKEYRVTPGKALMNIRLERAKYLLANTDDPCEKIAEQTGFSAASYFSKVFKENIQMSPHNYRKETIKRASSPGNYDYDH
ncbi:AraC family transcriptional regulator [Paenibacillus sp. YN15]|uniref:AraC family transcriptional regulator n=1 Tax=Paenibacillus sp. YN15 TaxID=1742774 RepID=UPI000DCC5851|nr:AraC family transcriptional regulator [Paenibacillus sp. YN15]RAV04706.1 hypothetical protein DQG13_05735 [Paenibacillus sp. YN15]